MEDSYNVSDPYGTYQTAGGDKPYEILMKMNAWQKEIRSTISKVSEDLTGVREQQTQILQNLDSIELNVLDIEKNASGQATQISQLLLSVQGITLNVANIDNRIGTAESTLKVQADAIASRVQLKDFTGATISSMIVQDAYSINLIANSLNLSGFVTFTSLQTEGATLINGSNIKTGAILASLIAGNLFVVGNGYTSTTLEMFTTDTGVHILRSNRGGDSYSGSGGFRIENMSGSIGLAANSGYGIYTSGAPLVAKSGFRVDSGTSQFNTNTTVNAILNASTLQQGGLPVATQTWVANMNYLTASSLSSYLSNYAQWSDTYRIARGGASLKFLYGAATIQARNYYDTGWGNFEGLAYSNVSRREWKKDIEPYKTDALQELIDTQVYAYRYKEDKDFEPKRVGLIYDESPLDVLHFGSGIDIYALASMLVRAVQQLNEKIEILEGA